MERWKSENLKICKMMEKWKNRKDFNFFHFCLVGSGIVRDEKSEFV